MASTHSQQFVHNLWNYCNLLRDGGLIYGDYVEPLTYLLFLKMADERTKAPYSEESLGTGGRQQGIVHRTGEDILCINRELDVPVGFGRIRREGSVL